MLVLATGWGGGPLVIIVTMVLTGAPFLARLARASTLDVAQAPFVQVSRTQGDSTFTILHRELVPNIVGPLLADSGMRFVGALYLAAALSLIGFGPETPKTDWAVMIGENAEGAGLNLWALVLPTLMIALLSISVNLILQAVADRIAPMTPNRGAASIEVDGLTVEDQTGHAVLRGVSFTLPSCARLGIVGESGAGKTTLALSLLGHFRPGLRHVAGTVRVAGRDVLAASPSSLRDYRRTVISFLGQVPAAALTPNMRVGSLVAELLHDGRRGRSVGGRLESVGLTGDSDSSRRYPHQLSQG